MNAQLGDSYLDGTHLERAAADGDVRRVRQLLNEGAHPDGRASQLIIGVDFFGPTPLLALAESAISMDWESAESVARLLLEAGADVHCKDGFGLTALHRAADTLKACYEDDQVMPGALAVVQLLLAHGANPNALDDHERAPLHLVCLTMEPAHRCEAIARALLEAGGAESLNSVSTTICDPGIRELQARMIAERLEAAWRGGQQVVRKSRF